jgi:thiol-disulfide isomerase/thioredoxin
MTKRTLLLTTLGVLATAFSSTAFAAPAPAPAVGTGIGQHIPPFTAQLVDPAGDRVRIEPFDSQRNPRLTAYIFVGTTCPATQSYAERFAELERTYGPKGLQVIFIYPNRDDTSETKRAFHKAKQWRSRFIDREGAAIARILQAQRTTEIFLVDPDGTVLYHGGFDDARHPDQVKQRFLTAAIDEHLAGKPVTVTQAPVLA